MKVWIYTLVSVILVSAVSLVGIFAVSLNRDRLKQIISSLLGFATGALFGDAFIHLIPESFEELGINITTSLFIILGMLIFFVLEKFVRWNHCHAHMPDEHLHPVAMLNLVGDAVHNLIDGMVISASFMVSIPLGITTALAVVLHEIPQEIGDFGVLVHGGLSPRKALGFNFLCSLTAVLGAVVTLLLGTYIKDYFLYLLPITAGGFIYIAGSDLIPELQNKCDVKFSASLAELILIIFGIGIMALLTLLE